MSREVWALKLGSSQLSLPTFTGTCARVRIHESGTTAGRRRSEVTAKGLDTVSAKAQNAIEALNVQKSP